ncbi:hypothetical protein HDU96_001414 [Phlyctochytrium bullatum]|nr:hypothetical protein HDU96_001414 [Phlyctochytrium bullatum]
MRQPAGVNLSIVRLQAQSITAPSPSFLHHRTAPNFHPEKHMQPSASLRHQSPATLSPSPSPYRLQPPRIARPAKDGIESPILQAHRNARKSVKLVRAALWILVQVLLTLALLSVVRSRHDLASRAPSASSSPAAVAERLLKAPVQAAGADVFGVRVRDTV